MAINPPTPEGFGYWIRHVAPGRPAFLERDDIVVGKGHGPKIWGNPNPIHNKASHWTWNKSPKPYDGTDDNYMEWFCMLEDHPYYTNNANNIAPTEIPDTLASNPIWGIF